MFRIVSLCILLTLIVALGITFFKVVAPFILPLFLAGVVAILAQPLFLYFVRRTNGRVRLASGLATATIALAILAPMTIGTAIASAQLYVFATDVASSSSWDEVFGTVREGADSHTDSLAEWAADLINKLRGLEVPEEETPDKPAEESTGTESGTPGENATGSGDSGPTLPVDSGPVLATAGTGAAPLLSQPEVTAPPVLPQAPQEASPSGEPRSNSPSQAGGAGEVVPSATTGEDPPESAGTGATIPETVSTGTTEEAADEFDTLSYLPELPLPGELSMPVQTTAAEREAVQDISTALRTGRPVTPEHLKSLVKAKVNAVLIDIGDRSLGLFTGVLFSLISAVVALLIFTVALYYFFADGTSLLTATEQLIPVHIEYQREMLQQFARVVRAVVSATFLAGLGQAVATTLALWMCGFNHLITLFVLCFLTSLIPMLGTWLVWGPCAILLALGNHWLAATLLTAYGIGIVGMLDNVIRTYVLNSDTKLHPLLALISVLGGLQVMGLWGVFIGPIVASCLHALVKIFNHELMVLSRSRFGDQAKAAAGALLVPADGSSTEIPPVALQGEPYASPAEAAASPQASVPPANAAAPSHAATKPAGDPRSQKSRKRR